MLGSRSFLGLPGLGTEITTGSPFLVRRAWDQQGYVSRGEREPDPTEDATRDERGEGPGGVRVLAPGWPHGTCRCYNLPAHRVQDTVTPSGSSWLQLGVYHLSPQELKLKTTH